MVDFVVFAGTIRPLPDYDALPPIEKYGIDWFALEAEDLNAASVQGIGYRDTVEFRTYALTVREAVRTGNPELIPGNGEIPKRLRSLVVEHRARREATRLGLDHS
jgi:hypothetical protein